MFVVPFLLFRLFSFLSRLDSRLESASLCRAFIGNKTNKGKLSKRHEQNGHKPSLLHHTRERTSSPTGTQPLCSPAIFRSAGGPVCRFLTFSHPGFASRLSLEAEPKVLCVTVYAREEAWAQSGVHLHLTFGILL